MYSITWRMCAILRLTSTFREFLGRVKLQQVACLNLLGNLVALGSGDIQVVIGEILEELDLFSVEIQGIQEEPEQVVDMHGGSGILLSSMSWWHFVAKMRSGAEKLLVEEMMFLGGNLVVAAEEPVGIQR